MNANDYELLTYLAIILMAAGGTYLMGRHMRQLRREIAEEMDAAGLGDEYRAELAKGAGRG